MASLYPKRNAYRVHLWFGPDWFVRSLQGYFSDTVIVKQSLKIWGNVLYECTKIARTDYINTINQEQYNNKTKHNIIVCVLYEINSKHVSLGGKTILKITIKANVYDPEWTPHRTPTTQIISTHKSRYIAVIFPMYTAWAVVWVASPSPKFAFVVVMLSVISYRCHVVCIL